VGVASSRRRPTVAVTASNLDLSGSTRSVGTTADLGGGGLLLRWSWSAGRIKVGVLGFLARQDKDLLDTSSH
jgi:hypothetical protein